MESLREERLKLMDQELWILGNTGLRLFGISEVKIKRLNPRQTDRALIVAQYDKIQLMLPEEWRYLPSRSQVAKKALYNLFKSQTRKADVLAIETFETLGADMHPSISYKGL